MANLKHPDPPGFADRLLGWICKPELLEEILGDLHEYYVELSPKPPWKRALLYWFHVAHFLRPFAIKRLEGAHKLNRYGMFKNFYLTTVRNLTKHKSYFLINVLGLAIGIASFTFISLYVINELTYDRFHSNYQNIYRVSNHAIIRGESNREATTAIPMAKLLRSNYPEVLKATRIQESGSLLVGEGAKKINEDGVLFADSSFFSVFDFKLLKGNPKTALADPHSMVLSQRYAKKYFGDKDPMGQQLLIDDDSTFYKITGIVEDIPANSHIKFDMMGSITSNDAWNADRWVSGGQHTYVVVKETTNIKELEDKIQVIFYDHMAPVIEYFTGLSITEWEGAGNAVRFVFTPIEQIHLYSESNGELESTGNISYLYIYGLIALIILLIAAFNFVNLATAHSATRAKEVGVRKVIGSTKINLVYQFIFESVWISLVATILAVLFVLLLMPSFSQLVGKDLAYGILSHYAGTLIILAVGVLVGILAGSYPSFVLSAFKPVDVLKGTVRSGVKSGWLRSFLVTAQFAAAIIIIVGTIAIYKQIDFMLSKNLGFDKDQMLVLKRPDWLGRNMDVFKQDLLKNPNIDIVSNSETIPGKGYAIRSYRRKDDPETFLLLNNQVAYEHLDLMGLELVDGRFFSKQFGSDSNAVVLNESAVDAFGYQDPIGKSLTSAFKKDRLLTIIGVVKDYHVESLHKRIVPMSLELAPNNNEGFLNVKMNNTMNVRATLEFIEDTWQTHSNDKPLQYFFFNEDYQNLYKSETSTASILFVFSGLSVFIACMGLIGLITYTASARRKEIGIRKVLGAGTRTLIRLLSIDTIRLIGIAILISWPLAYFAMDYWLQNFANRITVDPLIYVAATLLLLIIVGVTISFQTIRAALSNPAESLRAE